MGMFFVSQCCLVLLGDSLAPGRQASKRRIKLHTDLAWPESLDLQLVPVIVGDLGMELPHES